jgi:nucleoside recognition membrane protein YjiH
MDKKFSEKLKSSVSVQEIENFTRKHLTEVLAVAALVIGAISSSWDFFVGPKLTILFFTLGAVFGIFFPTQVEKGLNRVYGFSSKQETTTQLVLGAVKIVVAIFIPFVLFGVFGLLAGTSYHYYTRHAQIMSSNKPSKRSRDTSGDEHD